MHVDAIERADETQVLAVRGQLDIETGPVLGRAIDRALDRPNPRVVIDLTALEFCDSTGLSRLLLATNEAEDRGGWLRLAGPSPFLCRVLTTVGLSGRMPTFPDVEHAVRGTPGAV